MPDLPQRSAKVLIVYGTTEGHTGHVCQYLEHVLAESGHSVTICDVVLEPSGPKRYDLCFAAGSVHAGNYQPALVEYVRRHHEALNAMRSAFLSVSLSAAGKNPDDWEDLDQCVERFLHATGWSPTVVHHVAEASGSSQYDFFKRVALKIIAWRRGQAAITGGDYDLTGYEELGTFARAFVDDPQIELS